MYQIENIINEAVSRELQRARKDVDKSPTDAEIKAGNYKKGHVKILGFQITIENPKGSYRKGKDRNGKEWKTLMHNDYGYFVRTLGKDGDAIDVFIGPNLKSEKIFPIDQYINGQFDETKVMLGFDSAEEAKKAYLSNYEKDWKGFKYITEVDLDTFKKWLYDGKRQRKPFAKYKTLNENLEVEDKWNGEGEKMEPLKKVKISARFLYHCSPSENRKSILKNGIYASVGNEYRDWWSYEGPNGEIPDDDELEYLVFLSTTPRLWANNFDNTENFDIYRIDTRLLDNTCFYLDPDKYMALRGSVCYTGNIPPAAVELFDTNEKEMIDEIVLNEAFASQKLAKLAKEHGGIKVSRNGGIRDGANAFLRGNSVDLSKVTDDMLAGDVFKSDWDTNTPDQRNSCIIFNDGTAIAINPKSNGKKPLPKTRYGSVGDTGDHDKSRGGFVGNGKDSRTDEYNGFSVSNRAGIAQNYRNAINNNKRDIAYVNSHKEDYPNHREIVNRGENNIRDIKKNARELKAKTINESTLSNIIKEAIEEYFAGSRQEQAAYENAKDCLYYGYGFKFWFERNSELLGNDSELAKRIWTQAKNELGNE